MGFVSPGLGVGGAERWVVSLAKHFSPAVHVAGILSYCITDPLSPEASRICPLFGPYDAAKFMAGCDVMIAWGWEPLPEMFAGFRGRMIGVSHASPVQGWHCRMCAAMEKFPGIELVGVSRRSLDVWSGPHSGIYIPNGAEVDRVTPRHGRAATRARLGIPVTAKVALFMSRIAPEKRPELFADAILALPDVWHGVIAGSDIHGIGRNLPASPRLHVLPPVNHPGDLLAAADVFVLPSTSEAHPIALTEAWLASVPTVYSNWPFAGQLRHDHGADLGRVIPVECGPQTLASAIANAPSGVAVERVRRIAWKHYTASAMAARWENFLGITSEEYYRIPGTVSASALT